MPSSELRAGSVIALNKLLYAVIQEPESWSSNDDLVTALKSQGRLAKWSDEALHISACSLNTLKAAAEDTLDGGYSGLDQLRVNALEAIQDHKSAHQRRNKQTKSGLRQAVDEQERRIELLEQQNTLLVYLITELRGLAVKYANQADTTTQALCRREMRQISSKIAFSANSELIKKALRHET